LEARYFNKKIVATNIEPNIEALVGYLNHELCEANVDSIISCINTLEKRNAVSQEFPYKFTLESTANIYEEIFETFSK
jgi:hypothetical protein